MEYKESVVYFLSLIARRLLFQNLGLLKNRRFPYTDFTNCSKFCLVILASKS